MNIIIVELLDEAKMMLEKLGKGFLTSPQTIVISLHPKVLAYLRSQGIKALDSVSFFDNAAQHRIIMTSEAWTLKIVDQLNIIDEFGIEEGYREASIHYIRLYFNHFLWVLEILEAIKLKYDVKKIYTCMPQNLDQMYVPRGYLHDQERFWGALTKEFCRINAIDSEEFTIVEPQSDRFVKILGQIAHIAAKWMARFEFGLFSRNVTSADQVILVPGLSYRMDLILKEIKKTHLKAKCIMVWEADQVFKKELYKIYLTLTNIIKKIKGENILEMVIHLDLLKNLYKPKDSQLRKTERVFENLDKKFVSHYSKEFVYNQVNVNEFIQNKIMQGMFPEIKDLEHSTYALAQVFQKIKPKLLMSMYSSGIYYMMGELSNALGFRSLNISHGTHVSPNNEYERIENYRLARSVISNSYSTVAVQTPCADKFLDYYKDDRDRLHTGPLLYSVVTEEDRNSLREELFGANHQHLKVVVHASTQKDRASFRFHITETLDEYLVTLKDIVNAIKDQKDTFLIIRPHPICYLSEEEFRSLLPEAKNICFVNTGSFSRVLSAADMLISYSSTCIEEAVQNNIPVVLFDRWQRYNHFNVKETQIHDNLSPQPAYYVTTRTCLNWVIDEIFVGKKQWNENIDLKDYKYPKEYHYNFIQYVNETLRKEEVGV